MKEPGKRESADKPTRARFKELGGRIMAVSKNELERRESIWQQLRRKRKPK